MAPPHRALQHPYKDTVAPLPGVGNAGFSGPPALVRNDRPGRSRQGVSQRSLGDRSVQRPLPVSSNPWFFSCGGDEVCGADGSLCSQEIRAPRKVLEAPVEPHQHFAGIGAVLTVSASGEVNCLTANRPTLSGDTVQQKTRVYASS